MKWNVLLQTDLSWWHATKIFNLGIFSCHVGKNTHRIIAFSNTCIMKTCPSFAIYAMWSLIYTKMCNGLLNVLYRWRFWWYHWKPKAEMRSVFGFVIFIRWNPIIFHFFDYLIFYLWMSYTLDSQSHTKHNEKAWNMFIIKYY